jgi:WD40 repeat protein
VSGSGDRTVRIWDAVSGAVLHILEGHTDPVYSVAFSSDGSRIVSGSGDCTVRIWDAISRAVLHTLQGHIGLVTSVAFSSDGSHIVSGSANETVHIWDVDAGTSQHVPEGYDRHDLQSFLTDLPLCDGLSTSLRRLSGQHSFVSFFPQMSAYLSTKAAPTSSWMETTEDGYSAVRVVAPGDECVGFHTNVEIERSWIVVEIDL